MLSPEEGVESQDSPGPGDTGKVVSPAAAPADSLAASAPPPPPAWIPSPPAPSMEATPVVAAYQAAPVYEPPPAYQPPTAATPPAPRRRRTGRILLVIGLILVLLFAGLGTGAFLANSSLSNTYSPQRAVTDYLVAQKKGDTNGMLANATFLKGDGAYSQYFDKYALDQMMSISQNTDVKDVVVSGTKSVDDLTSAVTVSMIWNGSQRTQTYVVHKDTTRVHYNFYYSWRLDIPFAVVNVTLPKQAGSIHLDGIALPTGGNAAAIQTMQGFHFVTMDGTDLYDLSTQPANAIDGSASVVFPQKMSTKALAAAATEIKRNLVTCAPKDTSCFNHLYHSPGDPNFIYYMTVPGYGNVDFSTYQFTLTGDPSAGMTLVIQADPGKVAASGTCTSTLTIDSTKHYRLKGDWTATLTYQNGAAVSDITFDCAKAKA